MTTENTNKHTLPGWIQQQQQQSWQIEILIASGLILFLYSLPTYLINYLIDIQESKIPRAEEVILFFGGYIFSRALLIGFIVTLFLRSLWLAFLGINYAFPRGINFRNLSYSEYFTEKLRKTKSTTERIITLERICSLTFSVTIMVTLLTVGMFIFLAILFYGIFHIAPSLYTHFTPRVGFIFLVILLLMILGVIDWIFFDWLKRYPIISKLYYPVYNLFRWLSLSVLYHQEYLTFISNVKRWKVYGVFLLFFSIALVTSMSELSERFNNITPFTLFSTEEREFLKVPSFRYIQENNYENMLRENSRILTTAIQSDIISDNFLKVFVVYWKVHDETLDSLFRKHQVQTSFKRKTLRNFQRNDSLLQKAFNEFLKIKIDDRPFENNDWYFHKHPITGEAGFLTYLPLNNFTSGKHTLFIDHVRLVENNLQIRRRERITFYIN